MKNKSYINILECICGLLLLVMLICILLQVVFRGFLNVGLSWTEELARYGMIWLVYIGAIVSLEQGSHIAIDLLINRLSPKSQKYTRLASNLMILFFLFVLLKEGKKLILAPVIINQLTPGLGISTAYIYSVIPVCTSIMVIVLIGLIIKDIKELLIMRNEGTRKCQ